MFVRRGYWMRGACRPGFAPWAMGSRFFGPGEVRLAILSLLSESPRHGYDLIKLLAERSGGIYRASAGTIYPTLQQLEDEGLITAEAQEGKRTFRITDEGRRELRSEDESVRRIWRRAKMWRDWRAAFDPDSAEIIRPAERVVKAALHAMSGGEGSAGRVERVREILERALRDLENLGNDK